MWLTAAQKYVSLALTQLCPCFCRADAAFRVSTRIGVGVTSFGLVFLFLGVVTFFDASLLALGDVSCVASMLMILLIARRLAHAFCVDPLLGWNYIGYWATKSNISSTSLCTKSVTDTRCSQTVAFFARRNKLRGTACFMGGIVLVFLRYPFWGMLIEAFGFLNLFGCAQLKYCLHLTRI